jgi:23S rRNA (pseudouridine1915-N3)-methyltransferase
MRIQLLLLGKTKRPEIRTLLDDYITRIHHFAPIEIRELREDSSAALRKLEVRAGATVALLDAAGKEYDSKQFAGWLRGCRDRGAREIVFLCGAAGGFPDALARRATVRISLSPLTFSHELARVMLAEQIYRAFTMLAGHPYAK